MISKPNIPVGTRELMELLNGDKSAFVSDAYEALRPYLSIIAADIVATENPQNSGYMLLGIQRLKEKLDLFTLRQVQKTNTKN